MSRRTNTATWVESRSRWQINVQKDGQRRTFTSSKPGRTGQREANAKADAWLDDGLVQQNSRVLPLWQQFIEHEKTLSGPSNIEQLECYGRNYILPVIGHLRVDKLTEVKLQQVIDLSYKNGSLNPNAKKKRKTPAPLSKKTLRNIAQIEIRFCKYLRRTLRVTNLEPELTLPSAARTRQKVILQPEALQVLFRSEASTYRGQPITDPFIHAYRLQVSAGLRPGELVGLQIGDVRFPAGAPARLYIRRSVDWRRRTTEGKNQNAVREITLCPQAEQAIKAQLDLLRSQGIPLNYNTTLFQIPSQRSYIDHWKRYQLHNDIVSSRMVTPYELRHTFVSIAKYLPAGQVKLLVGHSAAMDTFGQYGHAINGDDERLAEAVGGLFDRVLNG